MMFGPQILTITFILLPVMLVAGYSFLVTRNQMMRHQKPGLVQHTGIHFSDNPVFLRSINENKWEDASAMMLFLRQAGVNLISTAIKYSVAGNAPRIGIRSSLKRNEVIFIDRNNLDIAIVEKIIFRNGGNMVRKEKQGRGLLISVC